jgi:predicted O-methyltransferase YrrM
MVAGRGPLVSVAFRPGRDVSLTEMVARDAPLSSELRSDENEFDAALAAIADVDGWLTPAQARRLWVRARALGPGSTIVEIGSFRGRSTIVLARARPERTELIAIDPHAGGDRLPQTSRREPSEGQRDFLSFRSNLRRTAVEGRVRHVRSHSLEALSVVPGQADLLFIDGAHRYKPVRADIERWGARVPPGGTMLLHDSFNAIGVTLAQLRTLWFSTEWRYCGRSGSLAEYRRESVSTRDSVVGAIRQLGQLGYFVRSLAIKAALVAHMRPLARALGHRMDAWPH